MKSTSRLWAFISCSAFIVAVASTGYKLIYTNITPGEDIYYGILNTNFDINQNGAATYQIQLEVAPGTGGIQPNLSIGYSSSSGNGILGNGFSLSGLASINRTGATPSEDGFKGGVNYNANDRFEINGSRLMNINSATGEYFYDGAIYMTETQSWSKTIAHGNAGNGPSWFSVIMANGNQAQFGNTPDSKVLAAGNSFNSGSKQGSVRNWLLNEEIDLNGNKIQYTYTTSPRDTTGNPISGVDASLGESYPDVIYYTSNGNLTPRRNIKFFYEMRTDTLLRFGGGAKVTIPVRLKSVQNWILDANNDSLLISDYRINYDKNAPLGVSRIVAVYQVGSKGAYSRSNTFKWTNGSNGLVAKTGINWTGPTTNTGYEGDFNGDGRTDIMPVSGNMVSKIYFAGNNGFDLLTLSSSINVTTNTYVADFNGDGLSDLFVCSTTTGKLYYSNGNGFIPYTSVSNLHITSNCTDCAWVSDFNGDGKADFFSIVGSSGYLSLASSSGLISTGTSYPNLKITSGQVIASDFNGDGLCDLFCGATGGGYIYYSNFSDSTGFQPPVPAGNISISSLNSCASCNLVADFNGDGMTDIITHVNQKYSLYYSSGQSFQDPVPLTNLKLNGSLNWASDFNGDALMDFYTINNDSATINYFYGTRFQNSKVAASNLSASNTWSGDFNGDGIADLFASNTKTIYYGGNTTDNLVPGYNQTPNLVTQINNGIGGTVSIDYKPITDSTVYSAATFASYANEIEGLGVQNNFSTTPLSFQQVSLYPFVKAQSATYVVERYTKSDGRSNAYAYLYNYAGALEDLDGYGWLGFRTMTETDSTGLKITINNFLQTYPYTGKIQSSTITDLDHTILKKSINTYSADTSLYGVLKSKIYLVSKLQERTTQYDNGQLAYTTGTNYQYDSFGNTTQIAYLGDTSEANILYSLNHYSNDTVNWLIGVLTQTIQSSDSSGDNKLTEKRYTYYPNSTHVKIDSTWINTNNSWITNGYGYNTYGYIIWKTDASGDTSFTAYDSVYNTFPVMQTSLHNQWGKSLVNYASYNAAYGKVIEVQDANKNIFRIELDQFGRDSIITGPDSAGNQTVLSELLYYLSDSAGYIQRSLLKNDWTNNSWDTSENVYDGLMRNYLNTWRGQAGQIIAQQTAYNSNNKILKKSTPYFINDLPAWTSITYDPLDRIQKIIHPGSADSTITILLHYNGTQVTMHEAWGTPDSSTSIFRFGFYDSTRKVIQHINKLGQSSSFTYDLLGRNLSATDPGGLTATYTYNSLGYITKAYNPSCGNVFYTYNIPQRMVYVINNSGDTIINVYDKLNRQIRQQLNKDDAYQFLYDLEGYENGMSNICKVIFPDTGMYYMYQYNPYGQQITAALHANGNTYSEMYAYNPDQSMNTMTYPDASVAKYTYYNNGLMQQISLKDSKSSDQSFNDFMTYQNYDAASNQLNIGYGNGVTRIASFHPSGKLQSYRIQNVNGAEYVNQTYNWNDANNLISIIDSVNSMYSQNFFYDKTGRLDSARGAYGIAGFEYNPSGNLTFKDSMSFQYSNYQVNSGNSVSGSKKYTASYDLNGNLKERTWINHNDTSNLTYNFNILNQLTSVTDQEDTLFIFIYNNYGQRIKKTDLVNDITTFYISPHYEITTTPDSVFYTKYVVSPGNIIASVTYAASTGISSGNSYPGVPVSGVLYLHQDFVNSTKITTTSSGNISTQVYYKPYGEIFELKGPDNYRYQFGSKELDESGLYYFNSRYYDPVTTRFISADDQLGGKMLQTDVYNRYAYVINNPILYYDPSGHELGDEAISAVLLVGLEVGADILTAGALTEVEVAVDAELAAEAVTEVGDDFLHALRQSRVAGTVDDNKAVSMYKAKRDAMNPHAERNLTQEVHNPRTGSVSQEDEYGNDVFTNVGSPNAEDLESEMNTLENFRQRFESTGQYTVYGDDNASIGKAYQFPMKQFKFTLSFDDYSLKVGSSFGDELKHAAIEGRGGKVFTAGTADLEADGRLIISDFSGHYRPTKPSLRMSDPIWRMLRNKGYLNFTTIVYQ